MIFTSWVFFKLFAITLIGLLVLPTRTFRQIFILCVSAAFYAYWQPSYLILLAAPSLIDYWCALQIDATTQPKIRKRWLLFSIVTNLGLLGYFKYTDFLITNFSALTGLSIQPLNIVLPVGISFFTFKTLSYTIDVYRGTIPVCRNLLQYAMFVSYFPDLVAGPIVRASVFLPQLVRTLRPSWDRTWIGAQIILLGLTKKLVIADRLAFLADAIFARPSEYSPLTVASGVFAYSLQIYCDFSGYSDMAIGISHIIGFDLPENFNMPYLATSPTDFWRRWHITLSSWLRDYLYIPLGGNRKGRTRMYINLLITMLLGGLWHGASWTFVFWGFLHGLGLAIHKLWIEQRKGRPLNDFLGWLLTFLFVSGTWIFFRSETFSRAKVIVFKLIGLYQGGVVWFYSPFFLVLPLVVLGHLLGMIAERQARSLANTEMNPPPGWGKRVYARNRGLFVIRPNPLSGLYVLVPIPGFIGGFVLTVWLLLVLVFGVMDSNPFIYFQF